MPILVETRLVPLTSINTDTYQRERKDSIVERIVHNFDIAQWDFPKVALRPDGCHIAMMGQHRVEAAREMEANDTWPFETPPGVLECRVVIGLPDKKAEAELFMKDAKNKAPLTPYDKHRANLDAWDPMAIDIQTALDTLEIPLVRRQRKANGHSLVAITAVKNIWNKGVRHPKGGGYIVYETLRIASKWGGEDIYRLDGFILQGLAAVLLETLQAGGKTTRLEKFVAKNAAITVAGWARRWANAKGLSTNIVLPYAEAIREHL